MLKTFTILFITSHGSVFEIKNDITFRSSTEFQYIFLKYSKTCVSNWDNSNTTDYSNCISSPDQIPIPFTALHWFNCGLFKPLLSELSNSIRGPLVTQINYNSNPAADKLAISNQFFTPEIEQKTASLVGSHRTD